MEKNKKVEHGKKYFFSPVQSSKESSNSDEEEQLGPNSRDNKIPRLKTLPTSLLGRSRSDIHPRKYSSLRKNEELIRQKREEKILKANKDLFAQKLNFSNEIDNFFSTSESLISNSSTVAASDSGYDPEDSLSITAKSVIKFLDDRLAESVNNSSHCDETGQDSALQEESFSSISTSYMELKSILYQINIFERKRESSDLDISRFENQLLRTLGNLPEGVQSELRTILEDTEADCDSSVNIFKDLVLKIIHKSQTARDPMLTYTILGSASKKSHQASSRTLILTNSHDKAPVDANSSRDLTLPASASSTLGPTDSETSDLNDSSFTRLEKLCLEDEAPKTPKPLPKSTKEQREFYERCRQQELRLSSLSPYVPKSTGSRSETDSSSRKNHLFVSSEVRGAASGSSPSLSNWSIDKAVQLAESHKNFDDLQKPGSGERIKSFTEEFNEKLEKYFEESDLWKNSKSLHESSLKAARIGQNLSSSSTWMKSRKKNSPLRKITDGFISKRLIISKKNKGFYNKSATISASKASCMLELIMSTSHAPENEISPAADLERTDSNKFGKSASDLLSPGWAAGAGGSSGTSADVLNVGNPIPEIIVTTSTPVSGVKSRLFEVTPAGRVGKYEKKYFFTPGKTPPVVVKKKIIFFPTPKKRAIPKPKVKSPVGAYIRGDLSASLIASSYRIRHEFLKKN